MSSLPSFSNVDRVTRIAIKVTDTNGVLVDVGSIQEISPSESRDVTAHFTFGGSNPEEPKVLIDGLVRSRTLSVKGMALWKNNLLTVFGNNGGDPFVSLIEQKTPFTIEIIKEKADKSEAMVIRFEDCLFSDYNYPMDMTSGNVAIVESATIQYRKAVMA